MQKIMLDVPYEEKDEAKLSIYSIIGVDAAVKVLKVVTLEMIIKMAEFNIVSEKYDKYLGVNDVNQAH